MPTEERWENRSDHRLLDMSSLYRIALQRHAAAVRYRNECIECERRVRDELKVARTARELAEESVAYWERALAVAEGFDQGGTDG